VQDILCWLEQTAHHPCTEETAGDFASHLMLALTRVQQGEELESAWTPQVRAEAQKLQVVAAWVEQIQRQVQQKLGLSLPAEEVDFVFLHLGTFLMRYDDPLVSHIVA
jgi:transcriptional regulatory protein LevR